MDLTLIGVSALGGAGMLWKLATLLWHQWAEPNEEEDEFEFGWSNDPGVQIGTIEEDGSTVIFQR